jgi:hypothetical protein
MMVYTILDGVGDYRLQPAPGYPYTRPGV